MRKYPFVLLCLLLTGITACSKSDISKTSAQPQTEPTQQEVKPQETKLIFRSKAAGDKLTPKELPILGTTQEQLDFRAKDAKAILNNQPRPSSPTTLAVLAGNPPPGVDICNLAFSAVTKAIFEECAEPGMSYFQAANTFGFAGDLSTEAGNSKTYTWRSSDGEGVVSLTFVDDKLASKSQVGLK